MGNQFPSGFANRFPVLYSRFPILPILFSICWFSTSAGLPAQEPVSPLPPPVTRGLYRSHWFEFLNAHLEDDARAAAAALEEMKKAGRGVGVRRLSDFSRTAIHEGRKAEAARRRDRAGRAYAAAAALDDANFSGTISRILFLFRSGSVREALRAIPESALAVFAARETRLMTASAVSIWGACAAAIALLGTIVLLLLRRFGQLQHDLEETATRLRAPGAAVPLGLILLLLPLAFGLAPPWIILFWGALVYAYAVPRERAVLACALVLCGILPGFLRFVARENVIERSPLYVAALDLHERREDASAEDGLRQASAVFAEDADVWLLLGIYAERAGDSERAVAAYDRAIQVGPNDYRPFLNRGNVHFTEGEFAQAIGDYDAASHRAPKSADVFYNLALARGEAYDFDGRRVALARARELSDRDVSYWSDHPTLARIVSAGYPLSRARRKIQQWNAQPKSRRLPGHVAPRALFSALASPLTIAPWVTLLLGVLLAAHRQRRGLASECARCGKAFCSRCKRYGDPPLYCSSCVRIPSRKEPLGIAAQLAQTTEARARVRRRDLICRVTSLLLPGTHRFFAQRPVSGFVVLFLFFFCVAAAVVGTSLFDPRELPPAGEPPLLLAFSVCAAFVIWAVSLIHAWRESHGA